MDNNILVVIGARNVATNEREVHDFYSTDPKALEMLLDLESFCPEVWECACGNGCLSEVLKSRGYHVYSTDLIDRGYGLSGVDFLETNQTFAGDIITNPPFKYAKEFVEKAIETVTDRHKVAMFLKLQFLEGKARRKLFEDFPPKKIYVSSSRLKCYLNGDPNENKNASAIAYAWFIWEKGYKGETIVRWFN